MDIGGAISGAWDSAKHWASEQAHAASDAAHDAVNTVTSVAADATHAASDFADHASQTFHDAADATVSGVKDTWNHVTSAATDVGNWASKTADDTANAVAKSDVGQSVSRNGQQALQDASAIGNDLRSGNFGALNKDLSTATTHYVDWRDSSLAWMGNQIDAGKQSAEQAIDGFRRDLVQFGADHGGVVGQALAESVSNYIGFEEGVVDSLYGMGKGVVQLADGASKLMDPLEWSVHLQDNLNRVETTANVVGTLSALTSPTMWALDPATNMKTAGALWNGITKDYQQYAAQGDWSKFTGHLVGDIGTLVLPFVGEAGAVGDVGRVGQATEGLADAGQLARTGELARDAGLASSFTDLFGPVERGLESPALAEVGELTAGEVAAGPANFMRANDQFLVNAANRAEIDANGVFDVVAHGTPNSIQVQTLSGQALVDHRVAARLIQESPGYVQGQPIRLLSCSTGAKDSGFAQNLANKLGVEVQAPDNLLWAYKDGKMVVAPKNALGQPDLTNLGSFRTFTPGKP